MAKKPSGNGYKLKTLNYYDETFVKDKADRDGVNIGIANGLKLTHFLNELFFANFDAGLKDAELTAALEAEYPNKEKFQPIGSYRAYYNAGVHGFGHWNGKAFESLTGDERLKAFREPKAEKTKKVAAEKVDDKKGSSKKKAAKKK